MKHVFVRTTARRAAGVFGAAWARLARLQARLAALLVASGLLAGVIYLPVVIHPGAQPAEERLPNPFFGLAIASPPGSDMALIGVEWFHAWQPTNPYPNAQAEFVPMLFDGLPQNGLPAGYSGVILVASEPDNPRLLNVSPQEMAERFKTTRQHYPNARLLCCGTLSYHPEWVADFIAAGGRPDDWQVHAYVEGPFDTNTIIGQLEALHQLTGGQYWITEYGVLNGDVAEFARLTGWLAQQPWIERIAPYTNRQPGTGEIWEIDPRVEMVSPAGVLTDIGAWYARYIDAQAR